MPVTPYSGAVEAFPKHSIFDPLIGQGQAARVLATNDEGEHFGWQLTADAATAHKITDPDRVAYGGLKTPSASRQAAMDAAAAAETTFQNKLTASRTIVKNQVTRVKAIAPASRNDQDKWLLALSFLVFNEE